MNENKKFEIDFNLSLDENFFIRTPEEIAPELIGKVLVKKENGKYLAGMIVETEAYLHKDDLACHSAVGKTERNAPMFEVGGTLYVYKIYGIHHCINVVTEDKGIGSAVLIRAMEPLIGLDIMKKNRGINNIVNLCKGPGNVAKAFGFDKSDNFKLLTTENLFIQRFNSIDNNKIIQCKRVGIKKSADLMLRFYLENSEFVSKKDKKIENN